MTEIIVATVRSYPRQSYGHSKPSTKAALDPSCLGARAPCCAGGPGPLALPRGMGGLGGRGLRHVASRKMTKRLPATPHQKTCSHSFVAHRALQEAFRSTRLDASSNLVVWILILISVSICCSPRLLTRRRTPRQESRTSS